MSVLVFDTETTGFVHASLPHNHANQPDIVQLAALLFDDDGRERGALSVLIDPAKPITEGAERAHGISKAIAARSGVQASTALLAFGDMLAKADTIVAHNLKFDASVMLTAWERAFTSDFRGLLVGKRAFCTMKAMTPVCKILGARARHQNDFKWPKLSECIEFLFGEKLEGAHDALVDTRACSRVFFEIQKRREATASRAAVSDEPVLSPEGDDQTRMAVGARNPGVEKSKKIV